jgi:hypothetical protein
MCVKPDDFENDLPDSDKGSEAEDFDELLEVIMDEYNDIEGAFVELVDSELDDEFDEDDHENRIIKICFGGTSSAASGGQAQIITGSSGEWTGCKITLGEASKETASYLKKIILHEIGHCLGLDHVQDSRKSIMSYFAEGRVTKLQADDKMGIAYLYPDNKGRSSESTTLGLSCATR